MKKKSLVLIIFTFFLMIGCAVPDTPNEDYNNRAEGYSNRAEAVSENINFDIIL